MGSGVSRVDETTLHRCTIPTPVGPLLALATDQALCALEFTRADRVSRLTARLARWFGPVQIVDAPDRRHPVLRQTHQWLEAYFAGGGADAVPLPLDMRGATFERRVWTELRTIALGQTTTYGAIARQVGAAGASRAVGAANGANPIAIVVPCHRVIGANGTLTGYGGGLDRKTWLLSHEARWRRDVPPAPGRLPLDG